MVTDRYGNELKKPDHEPTLQQSINSWALVNELIELGYCHNFQHERSDISNYIYKTSALIDKSLAIKEENEKEKKEEFELELAEHYASFESMPTVDAVKVGHAHWKNIGSGHAECSNCGMTVSSDYPASPCVHYCPF